MKLLRMYFPRQIFFQRYLKSIQYSALHCGLLASSTIPIESENLKERKMMKKCSKKTCAAAAHCTQLQPQLLRKVCHIIAKAIAAEMSRKTERKWFVSSSSSIHSSSFDSTPPSFLWLSQGVGLGFEPTQESTDFELEDL